MACLPPNQMGQPANQVPSHLGLAPGAPPAPLPQNQAIIIPKVRTFQEFYADTSKDPCAGHYACIMQHFDPEQPGAGAAEVLYDQAVNSNGTVHEAYFCCASTCRGP